ncbi:MAG: ABC transporter permease subunit [Planctomycetota bacterium]
MKTSGEKSSSMGAKTLRGRWWFPERWGSRVIPLLVPLLVGLPIVWSVSYSGLYSVGLIGRLSTGLTLRHWSAALATGGLVQSVIYSCAVAAISTLLATGGALLFMLLWPNARHSRWVVSLLCLPFATPAAVTALLVYQLLNPGGFVARVAAWCGLINSPADFPVLVNDRWSMGLIVAQTSMTWPLLLMFLWRSWSAGRIDRYCRVAESLGATSWQARRHVALPMLWFRVRPLCVLAFLTNLGAYELPLVLGRQSPQMFSVLTQRRFGQFDLEQRPQAFALAVVYLLLIGVGVAVMLRWRRRTA